MSPEKQRVAIGIACGWKSPTLPEVAALQEGWSTSGQHWLSPAGVLRPAHHMPDYLNDLNACHETEKVLTYEQKEQFVFWMNHIHPSADIHHSDTQKDFRLEVFSLVHSPAPQRCEAFLRTLGLWEEEANEPRNEPADLATVSDPLADMRARAEAGDVNAQRTLGDAYAHGMEVAKDRVESDRWYAMFSAPLPTEEEQ